MNRAQFNRVIRASGCTISPAAAIPVIKLLLILVIFISIPTRSFSQKIAVLAPVKTEQASLVVAALRAQLSKDLKPIDESMSETVFRSFAFANPFNLSDEESRNFGASVGSNVFLLVKSDTLRRTSFERDEYYESYAVYFLVSARTGNLIHWKYSKFEEDSPGEAKKKFFDSLFQTAKELSDKIKISESEEVAPGVSTALTVVESASDSVKGLRPPMPYRRLKPEYTVIAGLYDVLATVDIEVEIDAAGNVAGTAIQRWAGFGLDESVIKAVNEMKWRPADLGGKPLAMRILLRYNFRNIESGELSNSQ